MIDPTTAGLFLAPRGRLPKYRKGAIVAWGRKRGYLGSDDGDLIWVHEHNQPHRLPSAFFANEFRLDLSPGREGEPPPSIAPALHLIAEMLGEKASATPPSIQVVGTPDFWWVEVWWGDREEPTVHAFSPFPVEPDTGLPYATAWHGLDSGIPADWSEDLRIRRACVLILEALNNA